MGKSSQPMFSAKSTSAPPPRKPKNASVREREYLRPDEVELLLKAARKTGRYGQRDRTLILLMYRHGLRVKEASELRWSQVDFKGSCIHIKRCKHGKPATHPLYGDELRFLRHLLREHPESAYVFISERGAPLSQRTIHQIVSRAGRLAGLDFSVHPHMLRHGCGYYLANEGRDTRLIQDYLGHRQIQTTIIYTELAPGRFEGLWD